MTIDTLVYVLGGLGTLVVLIISGLVTALYFAIIKRMDEFGSQLAEHRAEEKEIRKDISDIKVMIAKGARRNAQIKRPQGKEVRNDIRGSNERKEPSDGESQTPTRMWQLRRGGQNDAGNIAVD